MDQRKIFNVLLLLIFIVLLVFVILKYQENKLLSQLLNEIRVEALSDLAKICKICGYMEAQEWLHLR